MVIPSKMRYDKPLPTGMCTATKCRCISTSQTISKSFEWAFRLSELDTWYELQRWMTFIEDAASQSCHDEKWALMDQSMLSIGESTLACSWNHSFKVPLSLFLLVRVFWLSLLLASEDASSWNSSSTSTFQATRVEWSSVLSKALQFEASMNSITGMHDRWCCYSCHWSKHKHEHTVLDE